MKKKKAKPRTKNQTEWFYLSTKGEISIHKLQVEHESEKRLTVIPCKGSDWKQCIPKNDAFPSYRLALLKAEEHLQTAVNNLQAKLGIFRTNLVHVQKELTRAL